MRGTVALLVRSLRQDSRNLFAHLSRSGIVLMMVVIVYSIMANEYLSVSPGLQVFQAVLWLNFLFISMAAIGYFATSITEEKSEGTLGLLRMAGISPLSLLFGKSVTRLWLALVLIAVQFPFALLAITLGGVDLTQVAATYVSLGAYTFFLSGVATLCSVASRKSLRAVVYMAVLSVLLWILPSIMDAVDDVAGAKFTIAWSERVEVVTEWVRSVSVLSRLQAVMSVTYDDPVIEKHFIASIIGGLLFYGVAWLTFDFFANRHIVNSVGRRARNLKKKLGLSAGRAWPSAIIWKDFAFDIGGLYGWILRLVILAAGATLFSLADWYYNPNFFDSEDVANHLFAVTLILVIIELAVQSVRVLSEEHAAKTLPLLAMLPTSHVTTLVSKYSAIVLGLVPYVVAFIVSFMLRPEMVGDFFEDLMDHSVNLFAFTYFMTLFGLFLTMNTFLGSYVKWGAIPLSFAILFMFTFCCLSTAGGRSGRNEIAAVFFVLSWLAAAATVALQIGISARFLKLQER